MFRKISVLLFLSCLFIIPARAGKPVGRFSLPDTSTWERLDADIDEMMGGLTVLVKAKDAKEYVLVFDKKSTVVEAATVGDKLTSTVDGLKASLSTKNEMTLVVAGRPWRGAVSFNKEDSITFYSGAFNVNLEIFSFCIMSEEETKLNLELKSFVANITILNNFPKSPANAFISKGNSLVSKSQYKLAMAEFDKAVKVGVVNWPAWYFRGICQRRMKDFNGAVTSLTKAAKLAPKSKIYLELGRAETELGHKVNAQKAFENGLKLNPENDEIYLHLGNLALREKQYDSALSEYNKSLILNPCNKWAACNSAEILVTIKNDRSGAQSLLEKAAIYRPADATIKSQIKSVKSANKTVVVAGKVNNPQPTKMTKLPDWVKNLPSLPNVAHITINAGLDYRKLTQAQYGGAVKSAKAGCRELLGPLSPKDEKRFDKKWQPMMEYPADECITYLEKLTPLLEKALATKVSLADKLLTYDRLWQEAGYATYYDEKIGSQIMSRVARQATIIKSLQSTLVNLSRELGNLGEPPNPEKLQAEASARHQRAMRALKRLLKKSATLEGAYDYQGEVRYEYLNNDKEKPYYSQSFATGRLNRRVFLPLKNISADTALFYKFSQREPAPKGEELFELDLGFGPDNFEVFLATSEDGAWVNYEYEKEDGVDDVYSTVYRPDEEGLTIEEYRLQDGELTHATKSYFKRIALNSSVKQYKDDMGPKALQKLLKKHRTDLKEGEVLFQKGMKLFKTYTSTNGFIPELPKVGELYWVLKDVSVSNSFPKKQMLIDLETEKVSLHKVTATAGKSSVETKSKKITKLYKMARTGAKHGKNYIAKVDEEETGTISYVLDKETEKVLTVKSHWSAAPLIIKDGGYWPITISGSGDWIFSINQPTDKKGKPSGFHVGQVFAYSDNLFLFKNPPKPNEKVCKGLRIPDDSELMEIRSSKLKEPMKFYAFFRTDCITENQKEYKISFTVSSQAGWSHVNYIYELKPMDPHEAEYYLNKTKDDLADSLAKINSIKQTTPKKPKQVVAKSTPKISDAEKEMNRERIELHTANIAFCNKAITDMKGQLKDLVSRLNSGKATKADIERYNHLRFKIICQQSNVVSEKDRINEVKTGRVTFSRTPFDEMCRAQVVHKVEAEVRTLVKAERGLRKAEMLARKLKGAEQKKAKQLITKVIAEGNSLNPERWTQLNGALQKLYQGHQDHELAMIEEKIAWKQCQLDMAENVKTGADTGMVVMSLAGGPIYVTTLYQTGVGFAEGGIIEGLKRGITTWSDAADIAVSGYKGWQKGGWLGMVEGASWSIIMNKGPEAALKRLNMRALRNADLEFKAPKVKVNVKAKVEVNIKIKVKKPGVDLSPTRAAQFKQELEYGEHLAEDFFDAHKRLRTAEIRKNVSPDQLNTMRMEVRQKAAAVNHSMPAKSYLKYKAEPIKGNAYSKTMDDILDDATSAFNWEMRNKGFNKQTLYSCRNASSKGAGMDSDLALKEQPFEIPVRAKDGSVTLKKNNWLTKNGKPVSLKKYQEEGSEALRAAYKKVTGGYSAKQSFVDMTTSIGHESYPDKTWLMLPKPGKHSDLAQSTKKLDAFFGKVDPKKVPDSLKITTTKADIMYKNQPELRKFGSMMESCRGTAKDLDTKFIPLIEHKIRTLNKIPVAKLTSFQKAKLVELKEVQGHLNKFSKCFTDIGEGKIPPYEWQRQFKKITGGDDVISVIRRITTITKSAAGY